MAIENLPLFSAMNREEVKPPFPHPQRPLTSQEAHFAIMEKVNACIAEVNHFEQRVRYEMEQFIARTESENTGFKEAIQASYNAFMETVQHEINNFEQASQNNFDLFRNDIDKRVADFETAINNSFTTLQGELIKASNAKIAELEELRVTLNKEYTAFRTEIQGLFNAFKTSVNKHMEEQDGKIEEYKNYMVDNILASTETIFNKKASNGEITEIMKTVYGDSRSFKGSLTYVEITALTDANNGDYYYCSDDEHYYQKTETAWVDIGTGDITLNNLLAFQTLTTGEQAVTETLNNGGALSLDVENANIVEVVELTMNDNKYLTAEGKVYDISSDKIRVSDPIPVTVGELYFVGGLNYKLGTGAINPFCAFYDVNDNPVKVVKDITPNGRTYREAVVCVPYGAHTMRVCDFPHVSISAKVYKISHYNYKDVNLNNYINSAMNNLIECFNKDTFNVSDIEIVKNEPFILGSGGVVSELTSGDMNYFVTDYINIEEGCIYHIKTKQGFGNRRYEILDANGNVILYEKSESSVSIKDEYIIAPKNSASIRLCSRNDIFEFQKVVDFNNTEVKNVKPWTGKKWVCVGDSLTEANSRTSYNYHDYISEVTGIEVVNMGQSGTGYARRQENGNAFYQRIVNVPTDCDVVTIFGSGNDMSAGLEVGTPTDTGTETLCGCINTTIDNLIAIMPAVQLGIVTPTPWVGYNPIVDNKMKQYSDAIIEICANRSIPCLDLYRCSNLRPWTEEGRNACYTKDDGNGVHPDETGHKIIASRFKAFLETLVL